MVVASGTSSRQVGAMTDHLCRAMRDAGIKGVSVEGQQHCDWVLVDAGDIIIHLFRPEVRDFYRIERLWDDSHMLPESDPDATESLSAL
jgi:ribosome-associated protein